jgi:hypothetical protein
LSLGTWAGLYGWDYLIWASELGILPGLGWATEMGWSTGWPGLVVCVELGWAGLDFFFCLVWSYELSELLGLVELRWVGILGCPGLLCWAVLLGWVLLLGWAVLHG